MRLVEFVIGLVNGMKKVKRKKEMRENCMAVGMEKEEMKINPFVLVNWKRRKKKREEKEKRYWNEKVTICAGLNFTQSRGLEELKIGDNSFNDSCGDLSKMKMNLSEFKRLKRIEIGNDCFKHVREFVIDGLESLESVKIGSKCFRIGDEERDDGVCRITNCPNLRQLEIGFRSFLDFKSFELSNVNSLQSIEFGNWCFVFAEGFSLKGE